MSHYPNVYSWPKTAVAATAGIEGKAAIDELPVIA
jgi:hypothetical protein